jgi:chromate transporter
MDTDTSSPAPASTAQSAAPSVSFGQALAFWLKLGFISFGGPAGQIAIMQRELVDARRWISQARFNHALNYCMLLPGPEAQQLATYIGWLMHGRAGGWAAGALFVLPSLFILIALSWVYVRFGSVPWIASVLWGVQCAVAAIVLHALVRVAKRSMPPFATKKMAAWIFMGLMATSFVAMSFFKVSFLWLVLIAALVTWLAAKRWPEQFTGKGHGGGSNKAHAPCLIDDDTPPPAHAAFSMRRLVTVLLLGTAALAASLAALALSLGWQNTLTQMGWFFTKAALITFGGAYAVLPYVTQAATQTYQWLSLDQMMAGLALGESTPGPLIMINAFVGFVGGWTKLPVGLEAQFTGAVLAACVATWFTFLPSFVFIFAGAPFIESTHGNLNITAPLAGISAVVVGAIASLALLFVQHTAFDRGVPDWPAMATMLAAAALLFKWDWSVLRVLAVCSVAGLVRVLV